MLGEVYGIVDVFLNDFYVGFVWIEVGDGSKYWFFIFVDIVGGIYWYIKFVIWLKGDIFLIMVSFGWIIIVDYFGFIGVFQLVFNIWKVQDLVDFCYVQVVILECYFIGYFEFGSQNVLLIRLAIIVCIFESVNFIFVFGFYEQCIVWGEVYGVGIFYVFGIYFYFKFFW